MMPSDNKKNGKGLRIGFIIGGAAMLWIIVIVVVLLQVLPLSVPGDADDVQEVSTEQTSSSAKIPTVTVNNGEQVILDCIEQSKAYVDDGKYTEAFAVLDTAEQLYGKDTRIDAQRTTVNVAKVLNEVSALEQDKDYVNAMICIENSPSDVKANVEIVQK